MEKDLLMVQFSRDGSEISAKPRVRSDNTAISMLLFYVHRIHIIYRMPTPDREKGHFRDRSSSVRMQVLHTSSIIHT